MKVKGGTYQLGNYGSFCDLLKSELKNESIFLEHSILNYLSCEEDVTRILESIQQIKAANLNIVIKKICKKLTPGKDRPQAFMDFFIMYFLNTGEVSLAEKVLVNELRHCIACRKSTRIKKLIGDYSTKVPIEKSFTGLCLLVASLIEGDLKQIESISKNQNIEFFNKNYDLISVYLRRKIFREISDENLLCIKIENLIYDFYNCHSKLFIVQKLKSALDFLLEVLYLNPDSDFVFHYSSFFLREIMPVKFKSLGVSEIHLIQLPETSSTSPMKFYKLETTPMMEHKRVDPKEQINAIINKTIKNFKLYAAAEAKPEDYDVIRIKESCWKKLVTNEMDIVEILSLSKDVATIRKYLLEKLNDRRLNVEKKISILSQVIVLSHMSGKKDEASMLCRYLIKVLPDHSAEKKVFIDMISRIEVPSNMFGKLA